MFLRPFNVRLHPALFFGALHMTGESRLLEGSCELLRGLDFLQDSTENQIAYPNQNVQWTLQFPFAPCAISLGAPYG